MGDDIVKVLLAIVGVAIVAVIVSKNASTTQLVSTSGTAFSQVLSAAISPVTGSGGLNSTVNLNSFGSALPALYGTGVL